jgi:hypothetical protein
MSFQFWKTLICAVVSGVGSTRNRTAHVANVWVAQETLFP